MTKPARLYLGKEDRARLFELADKETGGDVAALVHKLIVAHDRETVRYQASLANLARTSALMGMTGT